LLTLTPAAQAAGFTLSTFATGFPERSDGLGPLGITFPASGGVLVDDGPGNIRLFPSDTDGQDATQVAPTASYGTSNAAGLARVGNTLYLNMGQANRIVQVNDNGTVNHVISFPDQAIQNPDGVAVDTLNGHLFVSAFNGAIYDVDPVASTLTLFKNVPSDGLAFDAAHGILYAALYSAAGPGNRVQGFDIATKNVVFDSGPIQGGPDGIAVGMGTLVGNLFVNTNGGTLFEINLQTMAQTVIASAGSRGDFVAVDPTNGTLLVTQSDRILRLAAPSNGGFGSNPLSTTTQLSSSSTPSQFGQQVTFTAIVSSPGGASPQGAVVFTIDGVAQPAVSLTNVAGQEEAILQTSSLSAGTHVVTATYAGTTAFAASPSNTVDQVVLSTDGPRVVSVQRFGIHTMPTTIVLTFDRALDPTTAQDANEFRLADARGRKIGIRSADYKASTFTVTLHPVRRLNFHRRFVLKVNGSSSTGLKDSHGLLLDGQGTGKPGSDYVTNITASDLVPPDPPKHSRSQARDHAG
jgi:sugar lactone lactonase YvrE